MQLPVTNAEMKRRSYVEAVGRRATSRPPTRAKTLASHSTLASVNGGARCAKPPSGARDVPARTVINLYLLHCIDNNTI